MLISPQRYIKLNINIGITSSKYLSQLRSKVNFNFKVAESVRVESMLSVVITSNIKSLACNSCISISIEQSEDFDYNLFIIHEILRSLSSKFDIKFKDFKESLYEVSCTPINSEEEAVMHLKLVDMRTTIDHQFIINLAREGAFKNDSYGIKESFPSILIRIPLSAMEFDEIFLDKLDKSDLMKLIAEMIRENQDNMDIMDSSTDKETSTEKGEKREWEQRLKKTETKKIMKSKSLIFDGGGKPS